MLECEYGPIASALYFMLWTRLLEMEARERFRSIRLWNGLIDHRWSTIKLF